MAAKPKKEPKKIDIIPKKKVNKEPINPNPNEDKNIKKEPKILNIATIQ